MSLPSGSGVADLALHTARPRLSSVPDEPFRPVVVNRPGRDPGDRLKVVVFNGRGCGNPELIARRLSDPPLAGAGLILLCEVDWGLSRSARRDCAGELAERMGMSVAFGAEFGFGASADRFRAFFGNAILSALPLTDVRPIGLPILYDWAWRRFPGNSRRWKFRRGRRGAVTARITFKGKAINVAVLHLESRSHPRGRAQQVESFLRSFPAHGPAIVGGDFNTTTIDIGGRYGFLGALPRLLVEPRRFRRPQTREPLFGHFTRAGFDFSAANQQMAPTFTFTSAIPRLMRPKLDWIGLRDLAPVSGSARVVSARRGLGPRLSDHDFITCEIVA